MWVTDEENDSVTTTVTSSCGTECQYMDNE